MTGKPYFLYAPSLRSGAGSPLHGLLNSQRYHAQPGLMPFGTPGNLAAPRSAPSTTKQVTLPSGPGSHDCSPTVQPKCVRHCRRPPHSETDLVWRRQDRSGL